MNAIRTVVLIMAVLIAQPIRGQTFELDWFTIDGGGGAGSTSMDGAFDLSGTIGQPDGGVLTGGDFELIGGFWAVAATDDVVAGDCDGNGTVELADYACFPDCLSGPSAGLPSGCAIVDLDNDGDVDLQDFGDWTLLLES